MMDFEFTRDGQQIHLVASCLGDEDTGGGLLSHTPDAWVTLDDVSTIGLFAVSNQLVRMLSAPRNTKK